MALHFFPLKSLNLLVTQTKIFTEKKPNKQKNNLALGHTDDGQGVVAKPRARIPLPSQTLTVIVRVKLSLQLLHFPLVS